MEEDIDKDIQIKFVQINIENQHKQQQFQKNQKIKDIMFKFQQEHPEACQSFFQKIKKSNYLIDKLQSSQKTFCSAVNFFTQNHLDKEFQYLQVFGVKKMRLQYNRHPKFLKKIQRPYYPNLQQLCLAYNYIESVESLCILQTPCLQFLNLAWCYMLDFRWLRHSNFPKLNKLWIHQNCVKDIQDICFSMNAFDQITFDRNNLNSFEYLVKSKIKYKNNQQNSQCLPLKITIFSNILACTPYDFKKFQEYTLKLKIPLKSS